MSYSVNARNFIEVILDPLYRELKNNNIVNGTVEIIDAHVFFMANDETAMELGTHRKAQHKYIENEKKWYLSMDRCIKGHPGIEDNQIWSKICSDDGIVNSNYGWCVFSADNGTLSKGSIYTNAEYGGEHMSQYDFALQQLRLSPEGRQSIIYYSRPEMQWEWNDNINAKYDFTCTINTQHFIRNGKLDYIVNMRSNDAIRGLHCGDLPWHGYVYNKMLEDINKHRDINSYIKSGKIFWNAGSLHVYKRDFELLTKIVEEYREWYKDNLGPKTFPFVGG